MEDNRGCVKCGSRDAEQRDVAMTGTGLSKLFDVQSNQFIVVSCKNCGYSEFYSKQSSAAGNIFDFFFGA